MEPILVTGGAGAIGVNLVEALLGEGHNVIVLDDLSSGHGNELPSAAQFIKGSVADDKDLERAFASRPRHVFHLAALFANQNSVEHPEKDLIVNGLGTIKVLESCAKYGVEKVVYSSSSCVYGNSPRMNEDDPVSDTATPYAITKLLGEQYCKFWGQYHGRNVAIVRIFNTYGPGELPGPYRNVIPNFVDLALKGKPLPITGTGEESRDFNFCSDTSNGLMRAMFARTETGDVFNLASGKPTRIDRLARLINEATGNRAGVIYHEARKWDHIKARNPSTEKAERVLGYRASVPLEVGIPKTVDWLRARLKR